MQLLTHLVGRERDEVDLDIRRRQTRIGLEESAGGAGCDRQRSLAKRRILHAGHHLADGMIDDVVERDALRAPHHDADLQMILQIVANTRRIEHDVDAVRLQQLRRPDARELQELRRVIGAARHQDFLARPRDPQGSVLAVFDGARAASLEQQALRERGCLDV